MWKTDKGWRGEGVGQKELFCWFLSFGIALIVGGWGVVGWGRKSYLGPAEITSFFSWELSRRNKRDSFWFVVSTGYFYFLFLWVIVVSDFLPLEIHKHLVLPLPSITFTAKSEADNHFYKYIYLFQILQYEIGCSLKYTLRLFIFKFEFNVKYRLYFF